MRRNVLLRWLGLIAVATAAFVTGVVVGKRNVPPPVESTTSEDGQQLAQLTRQNTTLAAELDRTRRKLARLEGQFDERGQAYWALMSRFVEETPVEEPPYGEATMSLDALWARGRGIIGSDLLSTTDNPEPWLFYDAFADGLAYAVEIVRRGKEGARFLERIAMEPIEAVPEPVEGDDDKTVEAQRERSDLQERHRDLAVEVLQEMRHPEALAALLRLRRALPEEARPTVSVLGNHVHYLSSNEVAPHAGEIVRQCQEALADDPSAHGPLSALAYMAFLHDDAQAASILRSPALRDTNCVPALNAARDAQTQSSYRYVEWVARVSHDSETTASASDILTDWQW